MQGENSEESLIEAAERSNEQGQTNLRRIGNSNLTYTGFLLQHREQFEDSI